MSSQSLRFKLYSLLSLPIVALIALWTFAAGHVVGEYFELRTASTVYERINAPAAALIAALQHERKTSAMFLSAPPPDGSPLLDSRKRVDAAVERFEALAGSEEAETVTNAELRKSVQAVRQRLGSLSAIRRSVDDRSTSRLEVVSAYGDATDDVFRLYDQAVGVPEIRLYQQAMGLQRIAHARDMMSREDALVAGATIVGRLSREEYEAIEHLMPSRRLLFTEGVGALDSELRGPFDLLATSADNQRLMELEDEIVKTGSLPVMQSAWAPVAERLGGSLDRLLVSRSDLLNERTSAASNGIVLEISAVAALGLAAILGAVVWSVKLGRGLVAELDTLRHAAADLADVRLPTVVERLRAGRQVDVAAEVPPITEDGATQEVRDVGHAFDEVRRTAVEAAVGQAEMRRGLGRVFRNMARRNQSLVHRQLAQLDTIRRQINDPETLQELFRLDRLTTRMRRQSEGLIILSGGTSDPTTGDPVPIADVVREAVSEVEAYTRVNAPPIADAFLDAGAASDVTHLLAELLSNATSFSPPHTTVHVFGQLVGSGFAIEVEDRGLGISDAEREEINAKLADPPEFDLADSERLGLLVVALLARRHNIKVTLGKSAYGGITAIILLPQTIIASGLTRRSHSGKNRETVEWQPRRG
jgi:hypothetical protein